MASENIDDFLEKVDEIYGQVKGLVTDTISIEEVDAKQKKLEEEKRKKDVAKQIKEEEERQKIVKGRSGKGQSEDYISFCRHCFVEYTLPTPQCAHCGKATLSKEDRHAELKLKVDDYKQKKAAKQERKDKWDKWRKTQAMYWKKTSTNYSKWDYFTSSEEEDNDNSEPILPKNDPNFMAMEKDLEERMKKREADKKAATKFKEEGNEYLTKRDYLKAIESYTLGMERMKDMKELYTNRALAYLKLGNYEKVVADCTSMLEFTEVFEKGYNQSATLCYKALIRRAQAYREMNKLDEAIQDTEEALKLVPADKDALRMKGEFQLAKEQQEKAKTFKEESAEEAVEEDKQETSETQTTQNGTSTVQGQKSTTINLNDAAACRKAIDELLDQENPSKESIEKVVSVFKKNSDYKIYANEKGLAKKLVAWIKREDVERLIYLLVILFLQDNAVYIDQFFKNNGPSTLLKKLRTEAEAVQKGVEENKKAEFFQDLEEICEVFLNITENEKGRILLKDQPFLIEMLDAFYILVLTNLRAQKEAATSYFSLLSNLAAISNKFAKYLENHYLDKMMEQLVESVFKKTKTSKYNRIKENLYGLIANLCRETSVRAKLLTMTPVIEAFHNCLLQSLDSFAILNVTNMKWIRSVENILAIFINLTFGVSEELHKKIFVEKFRLLEHVMRYLNLSTKRNEYVPVVLRTLQLLSKLDFQEFVLKDYKELILASFNEHFTQKAKELELTNHAIRVYVKWVSKSNESVLRKYLKSSDFDKLIEKLIVIIKEDNEERFVNSTMLAGNIAEVFPECSSKFRECIPVLLNACKDKMGLWRKNAAICVAKLSKDPANLQAIRDLHGIEVLSSISRFVLEK